VPITSLSLLTTDALGMSVEELIGEQAKCGKAKQTKSKHSAATGRMSALPSPSSTPFPNYSTPCPRG